MIMTGLPVLLNVVSDILCVHRRPQYATLGEAHRVEAMLPFPPVGKGPTRQSCLLREQLPLLQKYTNFDLLSVSLSKVLPFPNEGADNICPSALCTAHGKTM